MFGHPDPYSENYTDENKITSLKGIEYLVFLTSLDINYHHVSDLDLTQNIRLDSLYCVGNRLTSLDLSGNPKIEYLRYQNNQLAFLDLSNQKNLLLLDCGENPLTGVITDSDTLYDFWCEPYTVNLTAHNGFFDLQSLQGLNPEKAYNWTEAAFLGHCLVLRNSGAITYTYDCESGRTACFEWHVTVEPGKTAMKLPAALKSIESKAFRGTSADRYIIPDGTEMIGDYAFADLEKPAWIQIPATLTTIADHAFDNSIVAVEAEQQSNIEQWCATHQIYCFPVPE